MAYATLEQFDQESDALVCSADKGAGDGKGAAYPGVSGNFAVCKWHELLEPRGFVFHCQEAKHRSTQP